MQFRNLRWSDNPVISHNYILSFAHFTHVTAFEMASFQCDWLSWLESLPLFEAPPTQNHDSPGDTPGQHLRTNWFIEKSTLPRILARLSHTGSWVSLMVL